MRGIKIYISAFKQAADSVFQTFSSRSTFKVLCLNKKENERVLARLSSYPTGHAAAAAAVLIYIQTTLSSSCFLLLKFLSGSCVFIWQWKMNLFPLILPLQVLVCCLRLINGHLMSDKFVLRRAAQGCLLCLSSSMLLVSFSWFLKSPISYLSLGCSHHLGWLMCWVFGLFDWFLALAGFSHVLVLVVYFVCEGLTVIKVIIWHFLVLDSIRLLHN